MNAFQKKLIIVLCFFNSFSAFDNNNSPAECITIAILAKDKAHTLPLYLLCLEQQTWPKEKTNLYIRTNNNNDNSAQILHDWVARVGHNYGKIYFDNSDVAEPIEQFTQHEWNYIRFKILGKIRQDSIDWAYAHNSHYFVADCDNFIHHDTIQQMFATGLPIVAPLLRCLNNKFYSNYHFAIDENGYYSPDPIYYQILEREIRGIIEVPVIHCTYFIRHEALDKLSYDDQSARFEYVIFSDSARKKNITQYIDNRQFYGYITFAESNEEFGPEEVMLKASLFYN